MTEQMNVDDKIQYVMGALAADGLYSSEEATAFCNAIVSSYMTEDQAVQLIKQEYGLE